MGELKIYLPDPLDQLFRRTAMTIHGYGRGSLSKAAVEALTKWCDEHNRSSGGSQTETALKEERNLPEQIKEPKAPDTPEPRTIPDQSIPDKSDSASPGSSLSSAGQ